MKVEVEADIYPSEDPDKVLNAVKNIFPKINFELTSDSVRGESSELSSLEKFRNLLGLQSIRDSARRVIERGCRGEEIKLYLNKQVATVSKVNFSDDETLLGPIEVTIKTDNTSDLIDFLATTKEKR